MTGFVLTDFNHTRVQRQVISKDVLDLIDNQLRAKNDAQEARAYNVAPSYLGDACLRRIQYKTTRVEGSQFTGKTLRIFDRGNRFELVVAEYLRMAGFELSVSGQDGRQHGFSIAKGQMRGRVDGIATDGPAVPSIIYPALWENKVLGAKGFTKLKNNGLAAAYPDYADTLALYQAYMNLETPALFTALCPDDMDLYVEAVEFDAARAQAVSDRGVKILQANACGELLPRAGSTPDKYPCKFCDFVDHCWTNQLGGDLGPMRKGK